ncbi:MAG: hypothetical protein K9L17_11720 [Clostridiales bacterium]|nr:hypothetical protein [Clostridiales bacterium]MCF8023350.1 hypothetical protein [Clostridiales bacterium]
MKCERCGCEFPEEEKCEHYGKTLCEDCYIEVIQPPKACDPIAVNIAENTRSQLGQTGTEGLTDLQAKIYNFLKEKEKVTKDQLAEVFDVSSEELEKQFAVLRHCKLVRGYKEGKQIYVTTMDD